MKQILILLLISTITITSYSQRRYFKNFVPLKQKINQRLKTVSYYENSNSPNKVEEYIYDKNGKVIEIIENKNTTTKITYTEPIFLPSQNKKYSTFESKINIHSPAKNINRTITLQGGKVSKMGIKHFQSNSKISFISMYDFGYQRIISATYHNGIVHSSISFDQNYIQNNTPNYKGTKL